MVPAFLAVMLASTSPSSTTQGRGAASASAARASRTWAGRVAPTRRRRAGPPPPRRRNRRAATALPGADSRAAPPRGVRPRRRRCGCHARAARRSRSAGFYARRRDPPRGWSTGPSPPTRRRPQDGGDVVPLEGEPQASGQAGHPERRCLVRAGRTRAKRRRGRGGAAIPTAKPVVGLARAATTCRRRAWDGQRVSPVVPPAGAEGSARWHRRRRYTRRRVGGHGLRLRGQSVIPHSIRWHRPAPVPVGERAPKRSLRCTNKTRRRHNCRPIHYSQPPAKSKGPP